MFFLILIFGHWIGLWAPFSILSFIIIIMTDSQDTHLCASFNVFFFHLVMPFWLLKIKNAHLLGLNFKVLSFGFSIEKQRNKSLYRLKIFYNVSFLSSFTLSIYAWLFSVSNTNVTPKDVNKSNIFLMSHSFTIVD